MMPQEQNNKPLLLLALVIFITRLPFLFSGYGSEEDAWGLILVARNIDLSGVYEVSRMPGHPVQELLLSLLWQQPPWLLNMITAAVSSFGVYYFMLALRYWGVRNYLTAGILMAFVPVYYINSTNVMDYNWAIALVMFAMFRLAKGDMVTAGIFLGLACGFRITAGAMVVPFSVLLMFNSGYFRNILVLGLTTSITALICFIPAFMVYGTGFFTYYEYFPYPPFLKNVYKATIGAWGLPGFAAISFAAVACFSGWIKLSPAEKSKIKPVLLMSLTAVLIYSYSFLRIPQKSAFVIPMIPFIVLPLSLILTRNAMSATAAMMLASCFLFGINLDDKLRGSGTSRLAFKTIIGNTPVAIDPLVGTVTADHLKRKQKIAYAKQLADQMKLVKEKSVIIAGWWQNELKYFSLGNSNPNVSYLYYADKKQLNDSIASGNRIFYLPEQEYYNDLRFNGNFTAEMAKPVDQLTVSDPL